MPIDDHTILSAVFRNLAVGAIVCDLAGHFIFFSAEAERILGVGATHAEFAEWSTAYGCYRPDRVTLMPLEELPLACALRGEEALHKLIFIRNPQRPDGLWIDASGTPLRDSSHGLCGAVVVFSDVSVPANLPDDDFAFEAQLKPWNDVAEPSPRADEQVSERFARFRAVYTQMAKAVEQTADSVFITDSRGIIEYVNPAFERITGYRAGEALGRKPNFLKSDQHDASFYRGLWDVLRSGRPFQGTIVNRDKSGELFSSHQTISPIVDQTGTITHYVSVLRDLTAILKTRERDYHLAMAREVQQRYYDTMAVSLPGFDIAVAVHPADETGGDYCDFIHRDDGSLYIVVADIAGHGFGAALVMAEVRASMRAYAETIPDMPQLLGHLNRTLVASLEANRFVTMILVRIDPSGRTLEFINAGHEHGYLLRERGEIGAVLSSTVPPLGLDPAQDYATGPALPLRRGDTIVLLTDGITESGAPSASQFGAAGALAFVRNQESLSAGQLAEGLYAAARDFAGGGPQMDDIMSVICKVE